MTRRQQPDKWSVEFAGVGTSLLSPPKLLAQGRFRQEDPANHGIKPSRKTCARSRKGPFDRRAGRCAQALVLSTKKKPNWIAASSFGHMSDSERHGEGGGGGGGGGRRGQGRGETTSTFIIFARAAATESRASFLAEYPSRTMLPMLRIWILLGFRKFLPILLSFYSRAGFGIMARDNYFLEGLPALKKQQDDGKLAARSTCTTSATVALYSPFSVPIPTS